jgi:hypothetical protein
VSTSRYVDEAVTVRPIVVIVALILGKYCHGPVYADFRVVAAFTFVSTGRE